MAYSLLQEGMQVVNVHGIPTHVYCRRARSEKSPFIMVVTGSPGMAHFYIPFVDRIFELHGGRSQVCVIGQAGHSPGVAKEKTGNNGRDWYSLEDQVEHKLAFLERYARDRDSLYLIGHSIGCYMLLQMRDKLAEDRVKRVILLFPTIERMAETPNGIRQAPLFSTLRPLFIAICWLLSLLPLSLKTFLLNHSSRLSSSPPDQRPHFIQAILNLTTASWYNILCMAHQEMTEVSVLPVDTIRAHLHKLVFYYGVGDQWNTPELCPRIQQLFPQGDITLCRHGYKHDFVLESANEMAEYCCDKMTS